MPTLSLTLLHVKSVVVATTTKQLAYNQIRSIIITPMSFVQFTVMRKPRPKCIALSYHYRLPPGTWKSVPPGSKWRQYASFPPYVVGPEYMYNENLSGDILSPLKVLSKEAKSKMTADGSYELYFSSYLCH